MQFTINPKNLACTMYFSDDTRVEITMEEPFALSESNNLRCSDLVTIKYLLPNEEVIEIFEVVTSDEFGGIINELQRMHVVPKLIDEAQAMDEAMYAGEPPVLNQADLQGGSDGSLG